MSKTTKNSSPRKRGLLGVLSFVRLAIKAIPHVYRAGKESWPHASNILVPIKIAWGTAGAADAERLRTMREQLHRKDLEKTI